MLADSVRDAALDAPLHAVVPVWHTVGSDTETPVAAFLKLRRGGTSFLLESAEQDGRLGRYSFIGVGPDTILRADADRGTLTSEGGVEAYVGAPLEAVRRLAGPVEVWRGAPGTDAARVYAELPGFVGGLVGAFGYDLARTIERLPAGAADETAFPAALFARYHTVVAFDHRRSALIALSLLPPAADDAARRDDLRRAEGRLAGVFDALRRGAAPVAATGSETPRGPARTDAACEPDDATFLAAVRRAVDAIHDGEAIQVVLSRRLCMPFERDAFDLYRALRTVSPAPYMFFLEFPEATLVGSSPEMLLRVEQGAAQLSPIAGTRRRGVGADEDGALEAELAADPKERAEHVMLVDLGRNDLGRVCRIGSVTVPRLMSVERFSHVMHLVSVVTGRLRDDVDALDALAACFPAGTLSGAPKVRAMELIDELETTGRGAYAGAVGHIAPGARALDACITIRSALVRHGRAWLRAGAGIVADSVPERELAETEEKLDGMRRALEAVA
ncbi:MAG TPA: anthranilate synthase component I family protein [Longimicrobiales bacterium]